MVKNLAFRRRVCGNRYVFTFGINAAADTVNNLYLKGILFSFGNVNVNGFNSKIVVIIKACGIVLRIVNGYGNAKLVCSIAYAVNIARGILTAGVVTR